MNKMKKKLKKIYNRLNRISCPVKIDDITLEPRCRGYGYKMGTPIDRYYIEKFLEEKKDVIKGDVLEVSEDTYTKKYGGNCKSHILSFDNSVKADNVVVGDLTDADSLPENRFDCFICTQTLNFIFDVESAIKNIYHILKENGIALVTVASVSQISKYDHERWGDYWRFTDQGIMTLFSKYFKEENIEVASYGNYFSAISLFSGIVVEDIKEKNVLDVKDDEFPVVICLKVMKN